MTYVHFDPPSFGDHVLAIATISLCFSVGGGSYVTKINWSLYSEPVINAAMAGVSYTALNMIGIQIGVQEHWNLLENGIIKIVDLIAPLVETDLSRKPPSKNFPSTIKNRINAKKRLLRRE